MTIAARERVLENPAKRLLPWMAIALALALALLTSLPANAQEAERPLIDVRHYDIDARIDPASSTLQATAKVTFIPREETNEVVFELHNGLDVERIETADGSTVNPLRYRQDFTVRATLPEQPIVGSETSLTFTYGGVLKGYEGSPVEGVDLANITPERSYMLYPARWFPVNGFEADQFAATIKLTVPAGFKVLGAGLSS
ncbi:MAG: hypothetical protein KDC27_03505, partial [Acidobacteria bacterium]|nr:hypothetical protein [Acidobacteriota bacterium]